MLTVEEVAVTDLPETLTDRTAFLLQLALGRAQAMGEEVLVEVGISGREYGLLAVIAHLGPCSQITAARTLGVDRTTTVALVGGLEVRGLLRRTPDPANRRANLVSLTDEGERVRARAAEALAACDDRFLDPLDAPDRERLRALLGRLVAGGDTHTG
jgi:DNA-binding MarR family transcriptional regulator